MDLEGLIPKFNLPCKQAGYLASMPPSPRRQPTPYFQCPSSYPIQSREPVMACHLDPGTRGCFADKQSQPLRAGVD